VSDGSSIQWCDATWQPVVGCTRVSAGCDNCYAIGTVHRFRKADGLTKLRKAHPQQSPMMPVGPVFVKQLGSDPWLPLPRPTAVRQELTLADYSGGDMSEWPAGLRVREVPQ
jgi:hypothetical protein